jgi:hypothetical protein
MTRIITPADLQGRSLTELQALFRSAQHALVQSEAGSPERREALASLDALSLAIAQRQTRGGPRL